MPFKLDFKRHHDFIEFKITGPESNLAVAKKYFAAVAEICRQEGCKKILIIDELPGGLSISEIYALVQILTLQGFAEFKTAFVGNGEDFTDNKLGEAVAKAKGANAMVFSDSDEAKEWLASS